MLEKLDSALEQLYYHFLQQLNHEMNQMHNQFKHTIHL